LRRKLSVRETERLVKSIRSKRPKRAAASRDSSLKDLELRLAKRLMTKVRIKTAGSGGALEIKFFSPADLERLLGILLD